MSTSNESPLPPRADPRPPKPPPSATGTLDENVQDWVAPAPRAPIDDEATKVQCPYCGKTIDITEKTEKEIRAKIAQVGHAHASCKKCDKVIRITVNFARQF